MSLLVFGSRTWTDAPPLFDVLNRLDPAFIIHGGARGADKLADDWAATRDVRCKVYIAEWTLRGKAAGPIRNQQMIDNGKPRLAVGFISGRVGSPWPKGSADMAARCQRAGVALRIYRDGGETDSTNPIGLNTTERP